MNFSLKIILLINVIAFCKSNEESIALDTENVLELETDVKADSKIDKKLPFPGNFGIKGPTLGKPYFRNSPINLLRPTYESSQEKLYQRPLSIGLGANLIGPPLPFPEVRFGGLGTAARFQPYNDVRGIYLPQSQSD